MAPADYAAWRSRIGVANQVVNTEVSLPDGRVHAIHHEPTQDGGWVATFEDITARRRAEADIRHMAHHDALTGLPNRARFIEHLQQTLARLQGKGSLEDHRAARGPGNWAVAVLFFDLDRFKGVNDTLGHAAGDRLLQLVAERASRCLRGDDMLARLGGDEFAMLLDETVTSGQEAAEIAQRVISTVSAPYMLDGHEAVIGASVGIALCKCDDGDDATGATLLRQADVALYRAKTAGRGTSSLFEGGKTVDQR
jgi:diguanylate cyclase (GGDEF)-like protein